MILVALAGLTTLGATVVFARSLLANGWDSLDAPLIALFVMLFSWISIAFWTATFGCAIRLFQSRPPRLSKPQMIAGLPPFPPTAVVMPIYNEDPARVFAGLAAMRESLRETGRAGAFDFLAHPELPYV